MNLDNLLTFFFVMCSILIFLNVRALWRDREIKGVSLIPMTLFFFVDLIQTVRFLAEGSALLASASFLMCVASATWFILAAIFLHKPGSETTILGE